MFVNLNVHSTYSKMAGTASPQELVHQTKRYNQSHLALTEKNGLWGFIRFVQYARDENIQPIAGVNIILSEAELVLLAENQSGYENICRIISKIHKDEHLEINQLFRDNHNGIFILSHHEKVLEQLKTFVDTNHLFVELRCGMTERSAGRMAKNLGLEMVATGDVYFLHPADQPVHKTLRAIDKNETLSRLTKSDFKPSDRFFRSEKQMTRLFPNSLSAINNSQYLADRCKTDWNYVNTIFPGLSLKATHSANRELRCRVYEGAGKRYQEITDTVRQRIEYELSLIIQKGFSTYFLIVRDIVSQTKATIGRGSGAASIVSYCLYITQVDPIKYNLVFERFIHPERVNMPDIDVDFPWDERDEILDYIFNKYGLERSAMVSNQVFMKPRSSIREVGKVFGLSNEEIKAITKRIGYMSRRTDLKEWVMKDKRFQNLNLDQTLERILLLSEKIIGAFQMSSVHPGGVIIVPDEISKYVPVLQAPKGVQIVEWEKDQVEDAGLLKIDILGNRSLAVVRDTLKQLKYYRGIDLNYHQIRGMEDLATQALMKSGKTMGVFYIESPATRQLLTKAGVADFEHVVIYSSIIRPAANRYINIMLERIHGKAWKLLHPDLKCLNESYGIMVYEEQVSLVARVIAGFSYAESDYLRKVISRSSLAHIVPLWRDKFLKGAEERGYTKKLAITLWKMIQSFSGYSFCKPHSASYARLSFTCAFLKVHYPAEFLSAVISNMGGYYSTYAYLSEARRQGITILQPHINLSEKCYKGKENKIRVGYMAIDNLKKKAVDAIINERKTGLFKDLRDFLSRMDIDLSDAMLLTNAGCFAELESGKTHKEIAFEVASFYLRKNKNQVHEPITDMMEKTILSKEEHVKLETEAFGFPLSEHPLAPYLPFFKNKIKKAVDIGKYKGKEINLLGVYITRKVVSTRKREPMEFVTFEDETDIFECVMFPAIYEKYGDLLNWETLFVLRGKVEEAWGVYTITISKLGSIPRVLEKMNKNKETKSVNYVNDKIGLNYTI